MDPGLIVAIVALVLIIVSIGVQAVVFRALRQWRERLSGLDANPAAERPYAPSPGPVEKEEVRQMLEATNHWREQHGFEPLDVDAEVKRLLGY